MTKAEAVTCFKTCILPEVLQRYGEHDKPAVRECWNDFAENIARTENADARNWVFPRELARWT